ncbi:hypothetical protein CVT24_010822 [Panaeolus cyanescens]|uniref:Arrestin C-terminal-like domain-containing protein n=1 Tax=Panaeolus cyanescens TaxID=181874 RepID=A0A409VH29_9AGAR|nr:hypothetical protein CVT24_010822 [Panaeolus cyanescens]
MPFANLPTDPPHDNHPLAGEVFEPLPTTSRQSSISTVHPNRLAHSPTSRQASAPLEVLTQLPHGALPGIEREYGPFHTIPSPMPHSTSGGSKPQISIALDQPYIVLNGTGPDVESSRMSGKVVLTLPEATSLRDLTLQFRGKARIPMPASESLINNTASITYVICNHEWHFLETPASTTSAAPTTGKKQHHPVRTLKAGQHVFPFHLDIGGTLPASLTTPVLGGASITYKLRAIAHRPALSLSPNPTYTTPVSIIRGFTPDALEYQQTLEIENTWPGKIMYSVVLPHKAWAGGDELVARLTLSPLSKGVKVLGVVSALWEVTKVWARSGWVEDTKVVVWGRSEIRHGKAVGVPMTGFGTWQGLGIGNVRGDWEGESAAASLGFIVSHLNDEDAQNGHDRAEDDSRAGSDVEDPGYVNNDVITLVKMKIPPTTFGQHGKQPHSRPATPGTTTPPYPLPSTSSAIPSANSSHPSSPLDTPAPHLTPSHSVDPIHTTHRIRWSIFLLNPDGHVSELRCSLPVHILDGRLLEEAKGSSLPVRRVLFSRRQVFGVTGDQNGEGSEMDVDDEFQGDEGPDSQFLEADRQLPSYHAHLRDRVANMFLPEGATMRVNNPWIPSSMPMSPDTEHSSGSGWQSPLPLPNGFGVSGADSMPNSPRHRPMDLIASDIPVSHTPPRVSSSTLLQRENRNPSYGSFPTLSAPTGAISTSSSSNHSIDRHVITGSTPLEYVNSELLLSLNNERSGGSRSQSRPQSRQGSRPGSRWVSRPHSRSGSPERGGEDHSGHGEPGSPGHGHGHGHHGLRHFIKATMRPFTALTSHSHPHSSSHSHTSSSRHSPTESTSSLPAHLPHSTPNSAQAQHFGLGNSHSTSHTHSHPNSLLHHPHTPQHTPSPLAASRSGSHASLAHVASSPSMAVGSVTAPDYLHRALAEVPDYSVAARGFMGGVPPLTSLQGLPSYEEASRHRSRNTETHAVDQTTTERAEDDADSDDGEGVIQMRVRNRATVAS